MSALYSAILDSNRGGQYHDTGRHAGHDCYILHRRCLHQTKRGAIEQLSAFHYQALRVDSYTVVVKYVRTDVVIKKLVTPRRGENISRRDEVRLDGRNINRDWKDIGALSR